jgi:hypothetical protein
MAKNDFLKVKIFEISVALDCAGFSIFDKKS